MNGKSAAAGEDAALPGFRYFPRLDGLRAMSITLVLIEHFLWTGVADLGVTLFFVISGFLITRILSAYRAALPTMAAAVLFFGRRALRLFPAYYACIGLAAGLGLGGVRHTWPINALYLTNVQVAFAGAWNGASHFWTLAVEEQFYLAWFPVVMLCSPARLRMAVLACLIAAPAFRGLLAGLGTSPFMDLLLPGVMDSLATGALLTLAPPPAWRPAWRWGRRHRPAIALAAFAAYILLRALLPPDAVAARILTRCLLDAACAALVSLSVAPGRLRGLDWLATPLPRHIGKISYGIYVWHYFVPPLLDPYLWRLDALAAPLARRLLRGLLLSGVALSIAELSWRCIEHPAMALKGRIRVAGKPIARFR